MLYSCPCDCELYFDCLLHPPSLYLLSPLLSIFVMPAHSKNNTARANFTSTEYEYAKQKWGSKSSRLGGDSMRNFDQCALCLGEAVEPMICREGHLYCKECIYTNLLEQKAEIKAQQTKLLRLADQQEEERLRARERARERVMKDFVRNEGFGAGAGRSSDAAEASTSNTESAETSSSGAIKRKAVGEPESSSLASLSSLPLRAQQVAQAAEDEALAAIEAELRTKRKNKLPSFWLPSLTPGEKEGDVDLKQLGSSMEPKCRVSNEHGHAISIKSLIPVTLSRPPAIPGDSSARKAKPMCPGCKKQLSNSNRLYTIRTCSHTFCNHCADELIFKPAKVLAKKLAAEADESRRESTGNGEKPKQQAIGSCPECDEGIIKSLEKDVIQLHREGTGFASAGGAEVRKKGLAFQG